MHFCIFIGISEERKNIIKSIKFLWQITAFSLLLWSGLCNWLMVSNPFFCIPKDCDFHNFFGKQLWLWCLSSYNLIHGLTSPQWSSLLHNRLSTTICYIVQHIVQDNLSWYTGHCAQQYGLFCWTLSRAVWHIVHNNLVSLIHFRYMPTTVNSVD